MRKRISLIILLIVSILFIGTKTYASGTNNLKEDFDLKTPYDGFNAIYGDMNLSNDLIYDVRYTVKDSTDDIIDGEIIYKYEILGDSNFNSFIDVLYRIENSLGTELKVTIGSKVIYDLVLGEYASIYECNLFDFTDYSDKLLSVGSFTYTDNLVSSDSKAIALIFQEKVKLDFLIGIKAKRGINKYLTLSNINAYDIEEIYSDIKKTHEAVLNHRILESNYYPVSNKINPGTYQVKVLSVDAFNELYIDKINIDVIENDNYFYCEDIKINFDEPITDEIIFKYYVHYYNKSDIKSYKIDSDYKLTANKEGIYDYKVTITDNNDNVLTYDAKIEVGDFKKPFLEVSCNCVGDGSYLSIEDIFTYSAYDNKDLDVTSKVLVYDIDDYEHNYNKAGIYRFLFTVKDNNKNENTKLVEYSVFVENEEIIDDVIENENIDNTEEIKEEKIEEKEEPKKIDTIKYDFYTDNETPLTREMIRQKLIFSGFYKENDNFSLSSDYFDNKEINGTYLLYVNLNNQTDCYSITVKDKVEASQILEEKDEVDVRFIIIASLIGLSLAGGIAFLIIKRVKKKK